ncbi:DUF2334 domain-containing protein [Candidatus Woesearchaeota archaeon]|nr:DUF2334 domain-containing protein [Candidatus Woesearchaeota archaeon]
MTRYLIRLDDISENMDFSKFNALKNIFTKYKIRPILGVIPKDKRARILNPNKNKEKLWKELNFAKKERWTIAQHGYIHTTEGTGGTLKINNYGEFGGLPYTYQLEKIKKGKKILEKEGFKPDIFIAPAHSFDKNTLKALKKENFRIVSDGAGFYPFKKDNLLFVPVIIWHAREFPFGIITICLHPDEFTDKGLKKLEKFIIKNRRKITNIDAVINKFNKTNIFTRTWFKTTNSLFNIAWLIALKTCLKKYGRK